MKITVYGLKTPSFFTEKKLTKKCHCPLDASKLILFFLPRSSDIIYNVILPYRKLNCLTFLVAIAINLQNQKQNAVKKLRLNRQTIYYTLLSHWSRSVARFLFLRSVSFCFLYNHDFLNFHNINKWTAWCCDLRLRRMRTL